MWCMKGRTLSVGLIKTKWNLQAIFRIGSLHLPSSRKNFSYLLVASSSAWPIRHHTNDQSVSYHYTDSYARLLAGIQHRCQYYESCDEIKDDSTPLRHFILLPNSVKTETIFPIWNPQNLNAENKFMYNYLPVLQFYRLLALSRFSPHFAV
jgi:hypothetical protein